MLLFFLFLFFKLREQPAIVAKDLDYVIIDKVYSSFLPVDKEANKVDLGYGDFVLYHFTEPIKNVRVKNLGSNFLLFFAGGAKTFNKFQELFIDRQTKFLLFFYFDTSFVDVYLPQYHKVVLLKQKTRVFPLRMFNAQGKELNIFIVRQPLSSRSIFAEKGKVLAKVYDYYFIFQLDSLMKMLVFKFDNYMAIGREVIFYPNLTKTKPLKTILRITENFFIISKDSFMFRLPDSALINYAQMDTLAILDIRYASSDNFVGYKLYQCAKCLLRYKVAKDLLLASKEFFSMGYRIVLFDCYRPFSIQKKMWQVAPNKNYVAPPSKKSMHNRGVAVDISLANNKVKLLDMGTDFDFFGPKAAFDYPYLSDIQRKNRIILRSVLQKNNFRPIRTEWWHFYHLPSIKYKALDLPIPCKE